ncbi:uracil-DNA glycosylase [Yinghuangia seranimata]|uniref:uracil-DNA glycosylase n=1 Tax=Yinghuangia seranimata TaxID=408067 RepID=UPI00248AF743|nr:uracil-DNA glycosylase [Yinghuangia seranimata]MDI2125317.1 uracil-DNA glycosylase [Yinghuangia seranimata]
MQTLPESWRPVLAEELTADYYAALTAFVDAERAQHQIFPPEDEVFAALEATPYEDVKVLIVGQDPYHDDNQAHGMCFSVRPGVKVPPSLRNIYKEAVTDIGLTVPDNGYLMPWAQQGVLLLNTVLTVRAHEAASHKNQGWEKFTDAVIKAVNERDKPVVFVLWGAHAKKKAALIDTSRHAIVEGAHPSPLSAKKFFGSKPFSQIDEALEKMGHEKIDWQIPNLA